MCTPLRAAGCALNLATAAGVFSLTRAPPKPPRDEEERPPSPGAAARALVLALVALGALGRGAADGAQLLLGPRCGAGPEWFLVRALAGSGFLCAYTALAVFLFALRRGVDGLPCPRAAALFSLLALAWAVFIGALAGRAAASTDAATAAACETAVLVIYALTCVGVTLALVVTRRGLWRALGDSPRSGRARAPPALLALLDRAVALAGGVCLAQGLRYALWAHGGFGLGCVGSCVADFLANLILELAPCLLGALLLRPRANASPPRGEQARLRGQSPHRPPRDRDRPTGRPLVGVQSAPAQPATELTKATYDATLARAPTA